MSPQISTSATTTTVDTRILTQGVEYVTAPAENTQVSYSVEPHAPSRR